MQYDIKHLVANYKCIYTVAITIIRHLEMENTKELRENLTIVSQISWYLQSDTLGLL